MIKRCFVILVLVALVIQLSPGSLFQTTAAEAQEPAPGSKISSLLALQVQAKLRASQAGGVSAASEAAQPAGQFDSLQLPGIRLEDLNRQQIFIHFSEEPTQSQIAELEADNVTLHLDSWIPPAGDHPTGFILADMLIDKLETLAKRDYVVRLETAERVLEPQNDLATQKINADDAWALGYNGTGVRIAVLDSGLDLTHPDIPTPVAKKDYSNYPLLDDTIANTVSGHGTHVTGSVLGRGTQSGGVYKGSAPGADLIFLKVGKDDGSLPVAAITNAIRAATDNYSADIITMSIGGWDAYHDGTSPESQAVDYAVSRGVVVLIAAGNDAASKKHYSGTVNASSTTGFIQINVTGAGTGDTTLLFNLVWYDGIAISNNLTMQFYDPNKNTIPTINEAQTQSSRGTEARMGYIGPSPGNFYAVPPGNSTPFVKVTNSSTSAQLFHLYVVPISAGSVTFQNADPYYTIASPADADSAIGVGAYTTRKVWYDYANNGWQATSETVDQISTFSNRGPRVDTGAPPKPNIVAPGTKIISARDNVVYPWANRSAYYIDNDGPNTDNSTKNNGSGPADYYLMQGTSMATPLAAGVAALILQKNPGWTPAQVKYLLESTATDKGTPGHDNDYGWGLVNALAAVSEPLAVTTNAADNITASSARLSGNLTSLGTAATANVSFQWGLTDNYTYETTALSMNATGTFSANLTSLSANTTYYFRAKAVGDNTSYGVDRTFTTSSYAISYWKFDEGSGTTASDSIDANHGTLYNFDWTANSGWATGKVGGALSFDGVDDYVEVANSANLAITNAITLEAWVYPTAFLSPWSNIILEKGIPPTWYGDYELGYYGSATSDPGYPEGATDYRFFLRLNNNQISIFSNSQVSLNTWTYVVATYDRATMKIYVNGVLENTLAYTQPLLTSGGNLRFGATLVITPNQMKGVIDEVAIYNRALSAEEIQQRYTLGTLMPPSVTTNSAGNITITSARLSGNLTSLGTAASANVSFQWGVTDNYTYETPVVSMNATGSFSYVLTGLSANTTYHFRAKAVGDNTSYGSDKSFTTLTPAPPPPFLLKWGSFGSGDGQFKGPTSIAVDASGNVYVADVSNHRIQKFTSSGAFVTKWGSYGSGNGQFLFPEGVAIDASGNVYVADTDNYRIQKFTSDGALLTKWGIYGSGDGQFGYPQDVAVDASGNVYVVDRYNNRIQKFSSSGVFITKWGSYGSGNSQFSDPYGVAVDASGNVYVADTDNYRIQKFTSDGIFITKWGTFGTGDGQLYNPRGVAVDASGSVYVADMSNQRLQKFTSSGGFIIKWGSYGSGNSQFSDPYDVAVDASGNVFVVDQSNHRIQVFGYPIPPSVTTNSADNITASSARLSGNLTSLGTATTVNVSFQWGVTDNYTYETPVVSMNVTGPFSYVLTDLSANTTYHFRAKAVGDNMTVYGDEKSFITKALAGDADGDGQVNAQDVTKVERIIALLDAQTPGADANQDGKINALDITRVERLIAGLD